MHTYILMYVSMHVCNIYMYMYPYLPSIQTYVCLFIYITKCIHSYSIYAYTCIHTFILIDTYMCVIYTPMSPHIHIFPYMAAEMYVYTYAIYTYHSHNDFASAEQKPTGFLVISIILTDPFIKDTGMLHRDTHRYLYVCHT